MVASRHPWRLDFLAAAINRSISAVVRYSRVRTEEFTVVGAGRPPLRFFTIFCPRSNITSELSSALVSIGTVGWYHGQPWARSEPTRTGRSAQGSPLRLVPLDNGRLRNLLRKPRSPARGNGAVQKARIIAPVTRATIVLIEVGSCGSALWTRPKPTTSVTQANASITTLRCVRRLAASSEKLFINMLPKDVPVVSRSPSLGRCYQPMRRGRAPASVPAPQQARPSSPDCTDRSHPHWSAGCSPMKSHDRSTLAGSCHGCDTAYPCRRRKGTSRAHPSDCAHRLRHSSEAGRAGASHPRSASIPATLPCERPWPRRTRPDHPHLRLRHSGSPCLQAARSKRSVHRYRPGQTLALPCGGMGRPDADRRVGSTPADRAGSPVAAYPAQ